jgi:hypothetical protein
MVQITTFPECINGNHDKCPRQHTAPPGHYGGSMCNCSCHNKKKAEIVVGKPIDHNGG